jgi:hypothetical protein
MPFNKVSDKVARKSEINGENNVEKSKLILEEANTILNKDNLIIDPLSTDGKLY